VLNEQFADRTSGGIPTVQIKPDNTTVIASSVSNGGAAAVAAAEQDTEGLIDGVAVGARARAHAQFVVDSPAGANAQVGARPLFDYSLAHSISAPRSPRAPSARTASRQCCRCPRSRSIAAPR
jgi:hydroxybutyrate-dimer hydrolase